MGERRKERGIRGLIGKKTGEGAEKNISVSDAKVEVERGRGRGMVGAIKKWENKRSTIKSDMKHQKWGEKQKNTKPLRINEGKLVIRNHKDYEVNLFSLFLFPSFLFSSISPLAFSFLRFSHPLLIPFLFSLILTLTSFFLSFVCLFNLPLPAFLQPTPPHSAGGRQ